MNTRVWHDVQFLRTPLRSLCLALSSPAAWLLAAGLSLSLGVQGGESPVPSHFNPLGDIQVAFVAVPSSPFNFQLRPETTPRPRLLQVGDALPNDFPGHHQSSRALPSRTQDVLSIDSRVSPAESLAPLDAVKATSPADARANFSRTPLFILQRRFAPHFDPGLTLALQPSAPTPSNSDAERLDISTMKGSLQSPVPPIPTPWEFQGNDGMGVKTWLSETHVLEINPQWLNFPMFDSMNLDTTDAPPGPGESEPQEWRSTFTVGLATDWQLTRLLAIHAGYRFYDNPVPNTVASGAYLNASQHVLATAISLRQGPHSLSLAYGLNLLDAASSSGISSARQGENLDSVAHLVTFAYDYSF